MPSKKSSSKTIKSTAIRKSNRAQKSTSAALAAKVTPSKRKTTSTKALKTTNPAVDTKKPSKKIKPASRKRKASEESDDLPAAKKAKTGSSKMAPLKKKKATVPKKTAVAPKKVAPQKAKVAVPKPKKELPTINIPSTKALDVYVFGENSAGELGLGTGTRRQVMNVMRPRLNQRLAAKLVGVVQIAVGGMHSAAITHDNKILTWGVNDNGALGRDTESAPLTDVKDGKESEDSDISNEADQDAGLNPSEAEPREVDSKHFPEGTKFAQVIAADSTTFVLTSTGMVYGWGTFRGNKGVLGFQCGGPKTQWTPILIPELKNIKTLVSGCNHIIALNHKGKTFVWGASEQNQLARLVLPRHAAGALVPREFGLQRKKIVAVGCGNYHSFAVDDKDNTYGWGLNGFAQCGTESDQDSASPTILKPTLIEGLQGNKVTQVSGGAHHSIAVTTDGRVLVWGRVDNAQSGLDLTTLTAGTYFQDAGGRIRYITTPTVIPGIDGTYITTGPDAGAAITTDGKAYTWGFNENYQTGRGKGDDIPIAGLVDNTAVRGKTLVFAGMGGQFGVLAGVAEEDEDEE